MTNQGRTVLLAFSGGLDTSYCLVALREQGWRVVTVTVDTGGVRAGRMEATAARARSLGCADHVAVDARERLYSEFVGPLVQANYLRGGVYPSCAGAERLVIASEVARAAVHHGAHAVAHGSTGAGNDHVRFDVAIAAEAPHVEIIAPVRDQGLTREFEASELVRRGVDVAPRTERYSVNEGMVGTTIGGAETDGSWEYLPPDAWPSTVAIDDAPAGGMEVLIDFAAGLPVRLSGADGAVLATGGMDIVDSLARLGATHAIGRGVHLGTTILGIKARVAFEAPALLILIAAHRELERLTLTARQQAVKEPLGTLFGDLVHEALAADPVFADIASLIESSQRRVTGSVRCLLHRGNIVVLGSRSPFSLLDSGRRLGAAYGLGSELWSGAQARGFALFHGLPGRIAAEASADRIGDPA